MADTMQDEANSLLTADCRLFSDPTPALPIGGQGVAEYNGYLHSAWLRTHGH